MAIFGLYCTNLHASLLKVSTRPSGFLRIFCLVFVANLLDTFVLVAYEFDLLFIFARVEINFQFQLQLL